MSAPLPKRIIKETERLQNEPVPGISATPHDDNARYFDVIVEGPGGSCYEGGVFHLELFLPDDYPMCPPRIRFLTRIYHPNIDRLGRICLDVLKNNWSPALQIRTILLSIQALLGAPNPEDPLNEAVAKQWKENQPEAIKTAKEWTELYAQKNATRMSFNLHPQRTSPDTAHDRPKTPTVKKKKSFASKFWHEEAAKSAVTVAPELPPIRPFSTIQIASVLGDAATTSEDFNIENAKTTDEAIPEREQKESEMTNQSPAPEHLDENLKLIPQFPEDDQKRAPFSMGKRIKKMLSRTKLADASAEDFPPMPTRSSSPLSFCCQGDVRCVTDSQVTITPRVSDNSSTVVASPESSINFSMPSFRREGSDSTTGIPDAPEQTPQDKKDQGATSSGAQCKTVTANRAPRAERRKFSKQDPPVIPPEEEAMSAITVQKTRESVHGCASFESTRQSPETSSADGDERARALKNWRSSLLIAERNIEQAFARAGQDLTEEQKKGVATKESSEHYSRASAPWYPKGELPFEEGYVERFTQALLDTQVLKRQEEMEELRISWFQRVIADRFERSHDAKTSTTATGVYSRTTSPTLPTRERAETASSTTLESFSSTPSSLNPSAPTPSGFTPAGSSRSGFTPSGSFSSGSSVIHTKLRHHEQASPLPHQTQAAPSQAGLGISTSQIAPPEDDGVLVASNIGRIKVDRDSKIQGRYAPKRNEAFFRQLSFERKARIEQQGRKDSTLSPLEGHSNFLGAPAGFDTGRENSASPIPCAQAFSSQDGIHPALRTPDPAVNSRVASRTTSPSSIYHNTESCSEDDDDGNVSDATARNGARSATPTARRPNVDNTADNDTSSDSSSDSSFGSGLSQYEDSAATPADGHDSSPGTPRPDSPTIPLHMAPTFRRPEPERPIPVPKPGSPRVHSPSVPNPPSPVAPATPSSASKPLYLQILEKSGVYKQAYGRPSTPASSADTVTVSDISQAPSERWSTRALRRQKFDVAVYGQQTGGGGLNLPDDSDTRSLTSSIGPSSIKTSILDADEEPALPAASPLPSMPLPFVPTNSPASGLGNGERPAIPARPAPRPPVSPSPLGLGKTRASPALTSAMTPSPLQYSSTNSRSASSPEVSSAPLRFYGAGMSPEPSPSPLRVGSMGMRRAELADESPLALRISKPTSNRMMGVDSSPSMSPSLPDSPLGQLRNNPAARQVRSRVETPRQVRFAIPPAAVSNNDEGPDVNTEVDVQIDEILASKVMQPQSPSIAEQILQAAPSTITPFARVMSDYQSLRRESQQPIPEFQGRAISDSPPKVTHFANVTNEYQHIRRRLQLELLKARSEDEPIHPHHNFGWASTNIKCKGQHVMARLDVDSAVRSPLLGVPPHPEEQNDGIKQCHVCGKACCHFANQVITCNNTDDKVLKTQTANSVYGLRGSHPAGLEPWSVLMVCSLCENIFCPKCGTIEDGEPTCKMCVRPESA
ncbi:hypothetical protein TI39_contig683g00006 [Zymoseptoria brevis]|uniref:Ubiquitin-conjugating enzyme E2 2 n=1 Tax=Zymoseptoria brevis TaxID=1047168 RepID=A0A0F4GFS0_9PEZI|nr:hypothetical protein TI39_contig683g00006 [Zymoseptoria brevis]